MGTMVAVVGRCQLQSPGRHPGFLEGAVMQPSACRRHSPLVP